MFQLPTATEVFNLRSRCADLAQKILQREPAPSSGEKYQTSHYNPKTNRCYVRVDVFPSAKDAATWETSLFDGQTGELLAKTSIEKVLSISGIPYHRDADMTEVQAALNAIGAVMEDDRQQ